MKRLPSAEPPRADQISSYVKGLRGDGDRIAGERYRCPRPRPAIFRKKSPRLATLFRRRLWFPKLDLGPIGIDDPGEFPAGITVVALDRDNALGFQAIEEGCEIVDREIQHELALRR